MDRYLALDPVLDDAQEKQDLVQAFREFAARCEERNGAELQYVGAPSTARDMARIRQALGERQLTYLGFSYGTYLGQWYAHFFPNRVRALALDGVFDPTASADSSLLLRAVGFQQNLDGFLAACRSDPTCIYTRRGNPEGRLMATMGALDRAPMRIGDRVLTRGMAMNALVAMLYYPSTWSYLDEALSALDNGDARLLLQLADYAAGRNSDGTYSSASKGGGSAIYCLDFGASSGIATYDERGPSLSGASELFGPYLQYSDLACMFWPAKGRQTHTPLTIAGSPPILLIGATSDPATPYIEAQSVAKQIPGSFLLTRKGYGHTSYFLSSCIKSDVDNYLITLTLPLAGKVCPS